MSKFTDQDAYDKWHAEGEAHAAGLSTAERVVMYRPGMDGCSDGGCIFKDNSKGIHTNGGCQCEKELRRHPQGLKAIQTIHFLRSQLRQLGT